MTTPRYTMNDVQEKLRTGQLNEQHLNVLRWLVWLSLLSREEVARVTAKNEQTLWPFLKRLTELDLIDYVSIHESGWPKDHFRYHITDLGLFVLAAKHAPALSAHKIAVSYPVTRLDLLARLARIRVHLVLSELVTRLLAEHPGEYCLTSYQQPYTETYTGLGDGKEHTLHFDAAFLLKARASGAHYAFYVRVDQHERMFTQREGKLFVKHLSALRQATQLKRDVMPQLLLLSSQERWAFWSEQLEGIALQHGHSLFSGAVADPTHLQQGAYAKMWLPFRALTPQDGHAWSLEAITDLLSLGATPATRQGIERFSHAFSFERVLLSSDEQTQVRTMVQLPRYVDVSLRDEAAVLHAVTHPSLGYPGKDLPVSIARIAEPYHSHLADRLAMTGQLNLALTGPQKDMLAHLARHPYLTSDDLLMLVYPDELPQERTIRKQIMPLIHVRLANVYPWDEATREEDRERYYLLEAGLRFLAMRHGLSPAYYLFPLLPTKDLKNPHEKKRRISPLSSQVVWRQHGAKLLRDQMHHTAGLYRCVRSLLDASHTSEKYHIAYWKSAQESVGWYRDPITQDIRLIRPDAGLFYTTPTSPFPRSLLIEYDRATSFVRDYALKLRSYADYQHDTRTLLPPVIFITQNAQSVQTIEKAIATENAFDVPVVMVLEETLLHDGLLALLEHPSLRTPSLRLLDRKR